MSKIFEDQIPFLFRMCYQLALESPDGDIYPKNAALLVDDKLGAVRVGASSDLSSLKNSEMIKSIFESYPEYEIDKYNPHRNVLIKSTTEGIKTSGLSMFTLHGIKPESIMLLVCCGIRSVYFHKPTMEQVVKYERVLEVLSKNKIKVNMIDCPLEKQK